MREGSQWRPPCLLARMRMCTYCVSNKKNTNRSFKGVLRYHGEPPSDPPSALGHNVHKIHGSPLVSHNSPPPATPAQPSRASSAAPAQPRQPSRASPAVPGQHRKPSHATQRHASPATPAQPRHASPAILGQSYQPSQKM